MVAVADETIDDKNSGKEVTLEGRLSSVVEQRHSHWLLRRKEVVPRRGPRYSSRAR